MNTDQINWNFLVCGKTRIRNIEDNPSVLEKKFNEMWKYQQISTIIQIQKKQTNMRYNYRNLPMAKLTTPPSHMPGSLT